VTIGAAPPVQRSSAAGPFDNIILRLSAFP
jgi:hypothetical protein